MILIFFGFGILVGSCNSSSDGSEVNGSPRACLSTLSLDTIAVPKSGFRFYLVLDFWLAWATTGLRVLFVQHVNLTQALDGNLSHSDLPFLESRCRLTQLWLVK